jgi:5-methylcytosine-specific restriction endonuclease McrA
VTQRAMAQTPRIGLESEEKKALTTLRKEAKRHKATLHREGQGGLPPSVALGVFRRDEFRCKACGTRQRLYIHHKGGIPLSPRLSRLGHSDAMNNLVVLCARCHDRLHEQAKAQGIDSDQVTPVGDIATNRDKGRPIAQ